MTSEIMASSAEDEGAELFLSFVDAAEELRVLWRRCSSHPDLLQSETVLTSDFRRYENQTVFELYLDCEAKSGKAFAWCTDVERRGQRWIVRRDVRMNDREGQHVLVELPDTEFESTRGLAKRLPGLVGELTATFDRVDLASRPSNTASEDSRGF